MDLMKALELGDMLSVIENCILTRQSHTVDYLYIHMMGKIRLDESPDLSSNDAMMLRFLTKNSARNTDVDNACREALRNNRYPNLSVNHLKPIEQQIIGLKGKCYPFDYPIESKLERAREAGYL